MKQHEVDPTEDSLNDSSIPTNEEIIILFLKDEVPEVHITTI